MFISAIEISARLPETLWGWVAVLGGIAGFLSLILGFVIRTGRGHIDRKIQVDMKDVKAEIKDSIDDAIQPLADKIDTFGEGRVQFGERLTKLESTINNGLTGKVGQTATDVEAMKVQVAEMYGWMKATHGTAWEGEERRNG